MRTMNGNEIKVEVGTGLYLRQEGRSYGASYDVKRPYFVESVSDKEIVISEADTEWENGRYFDSMPTAITRNPNSHKIVLHWSNTISGGCWWAYKDSTGRDYPLVAHFGEAEYFPYID